MTNRKYPERPIVGVGGILFDGKKVLLGLRGKEPGLGKWSIPGGAVKVGETLEEAVKREIKEEVGLDVEVKRMVAILDRIIRDETGKIAYHYILIDFLCVSQDGSNPKAGSDLIECRYVSIEELENYNLTRGTKAVIEKAFEMLKSDSSKLILYDPTL